MVTEDRLRRKKLHSQLKLEAKIHDLEVTLDFFSQTVTGLLITLSTPMILIAKCYGFIGFSVSNMYICGSILKISL